jgi:hypothetical protein
MTQDQVQTVYHYTSPQGAYKILRSKTLWFTDSEYLNDKNEKNALTAGERQYVLCTSCNSDTVAMWDYYVKNNAYQGYNLGIDVQSLKYILKQSIDYENMNSGQEPIVFHSKKVKYSSSPDDKVVTKPDDNVFTKYSAFRSEEEFRFVLTIPKNYTFLESTMEKRKTLTPKFRVGTSGIITPYIEWFFGIDHKASLFTKITLGPMIEQDLAEKSFRRFLDTDVWQGIEIASSKLKMRY